VSTTTLSLSKPPIDSCCFCVFSGFPMRNRLTVSQFCLDFWCLGKFWVDFDWEIGKLYMLIDYGMLYTGIMSRLEVNW